MKKNDVKALHNLQVPELDKKRAELAKEFSKARMDHSVGRLKNVRILSSLRADIARVSTLLVLKKKEVKA